jgi:CubicO group peptidase (beta-lactamase class C family)
VRASSRAERRGGRVGRRVGIALVAALVAGAAAVVVLLITGALSGSRFRAPGGIADVTTRIARAVPPSLRTAHVPGAAVAVAHDGRVAWAGGFGSAGRGTAVTAATRFQVGSLSKPVTAWGAVRLAERGMLALDAPIATWLHPWPLAPSQYDPRGITPRRLLSHTAGLSVDGYNGLDPDAPLPSTADSLAGRGPAGSATAVRLVDRPGARWRYSGGGYTLLQEAIEQVTDRPFARWASEAILRPLGMSASGFGWPPPGEGAVADGHDVDGRPVPGYRYAELAAAGLASSARDMGRFAAALLRGGPTVAALAAPQPATDGHWGLGLEISRLADGTRVVSHEGVNRGWHARLVVYPGRDWAFAVLTNGDGGGAVADAVQREFER